MEIGPPPCFPPKKGLEIDGNPLKSHEIPLLFSLRSAPRHLSSSVEALFTLVLQRLTSQLVGPVLGIQPWPLANGLLKHLGLRPNAVHIASMLSADALRSAWVMALQRLYGFERWLEVVTNSMRLADLGYNVYIPLYIVDSSTYIV